MSHLGPDARKKVRKAIYEVITAQPAKTGPTVDFLLEVQADIDALVEKLIADAKRKCG